MNKIMTEQYLQILLSLSWLILSIFNTSGSFTAVQMSPLNYSQPASPNEFRSSDYHKGKKREDKLNLLQNEQAQHQIRNIIIINMFKINNLPNYWISDWVSIGSSGSMRSSKHRVLARVWNESCYIRTLWKPADVLSTDQMARETLEL